MAKRVALLTNFIPPYRLPLYEAIAAGVPEFQVFISTPMEPNRSWTPNWESLNVKLQKTLTLKRSWKHPHGFSEDFYVHFPYDTFWLLMKYQPDIVISGEMGLRTLQALIYRKLNPSSRAILWATVSEYSEQGRGKLREGLRQVVLPQADAVMVNGKSGSRYVRQFGVSEDRIFFAPYTTNIEPFMDVPISRSPEVAHRLLYVGQLVERKGIMPFLSTLRCWIQKNPERKLELWIVGDGPLREALAQEKTITNLEVQFLGNVEYKNLPKIYAQGGIFVFPTLADEWGLVTNEAMAAGLPVLGSLYSQSVEELIVEGETGWTFRPDQPEEMYDALDRSLLTSHEALENMRVKAREQISHLTPKFVATSIFKAIEEVSSPLK